MEQTNKKYEVSGSINGQLEPVERLGQILGLRFTALVWAKDELDAQALIQEAYGGAGRIVLDQVIEINVQ